jgi:hypothetical protein
MKKMLCKITALIISGIMVTSMLCSCKKGEVKQNASISATKTLASTNTTAKTSAKTATQATTNVKTGNKDISESDASTAVNTENDVQKEQAGNTDEVEWAQDVEISVGGELGENNFDLKGRTIHAACWGLSLVPVDSPESTPDMVILARRIKAAEQKYNFKLEWYYDIGNSSVNYRKDIITKTMAGVLFADVFKTAASYDLPNNIKNNIIIPLDEYIDYEKPILKANTYMYSGSLWKGKHYGITNQYQNANPFLMYNKSILDWEGQPDILDLVEANQWNWSTFLEVARNCTRDLNGDGIIDQYGLVTYNKWYLVKYLLASNGLTSGLEVTDNDITPIIKLPQAIRVFQFVNDLCYVDKVYVFDQYGKGNIYKNNKAAMFIHNTYAGNTTMLKAGLNSFIAPMPMGPDVDYYTNINTALFYSISSLCEIPNEVAKIWAEICLMWTEDLQPISEVSELTSKYYPADWLWNPSNPSRAMTTEREFNLCIKGLWPVYKPDFTDGFPNYSTQMTNLIANPIMDGIMSVSQAIDAAEPVLQDIIEQFK